MEKNFAERVERIIEFITLMISKEKLHFLFVVAPPPKKLQFFFIRTSEWFFIVIITFPLRRKLLVCASPSHQSDIRTRRTRPPTTRYSPAVLCCWIVCGHNNLCANNYDSVLHELHRVQFQTVGKGYPRSFVVLRSCSNVRPPTTPPTTVHWVGVTLCCTGYSTKCFFYVVRRIIAVKTRRETIFHYHHHGFEVRKIVFRIFHFLPFTSSKLYGLQTGAQASSVLLPIQSFGPSIFIWHRWTRARWLWSSWEIGFNFSDVFIGLTRI